MNDSALPIDPAGSPVDLLLRNATMVATGDPDLGEIAGGWLAITDGVVVDAGPTGTEPPAARTVDVSGCLVTPGLINTHHHIYQNLTRSFRPATDKNLFGWLTTLYPIWAGLDEEAAYLSAWIGLAELALGGCTTSMDHLYVHPTGGGDLITAEITAARELGMRFHATRGSMSRSQKDGGLPPDSVVQDDDTILAESERLVKAHHERGPQAMIQVALAPCSPFSVTPGLMRKTAELAETLDVRLHTHLAEDKDEDTYCLDVYGCRPVEYFEDVGWGSDRAWVAHCVYPNQHEIEKLAAWGTGVAHCPSSNQMIGAGLAPVREFRDAGVTVGIGCDGSSSTDAANLWMETRNALMLARLRGGPEAMQAREALEIATVGSARCLGRAGELGVLRPGAAGDVAVWPLEGIRFAGALSDPIEALLRCGPVSPRHTIVAGRFVVEDGHLADPRVEEMLGRHHAVAARLQGLSL